MKLIQKHRSLACRSPTPQQLIGRKQKQLLENLLEKPEADAVHALASILKDFRGDFVQIIEVGNESMFRGRYHVASFIYSTWAQKDPRNADAWSNFGASLIRLRRIEEARDVLNYGIELDPNNANLHINLAGVLQELGEFQEALKISLDAVRLDPRSALAFNNLSSALADLGMVEQALHACETALMLDADNEYARINRVKLEMRLGRSHGSLEQMEALLAEEESRGGLQADLLRYHLAFEYLARGRIEQGFQCYESGLSPYIPHGMARMPARQFAVPRWDGRPLSADQTLLVWREQGIGDEILFSTCLHELEALPCKVIIETDSRFVPIYQRSYPAFKVRAQAFLPHERNTPVFHDYDFQLPIGSLPHLFRHDLQSFERGLQRSLQPNPVLVQKYTERLRPFQGQRLVGICWRSGMTNVMRNSSYTHLGDWRDILTLPGHQFVMLQYGECEAEVTEVERALGVRIVRWDDLNLKNDLDDVFALMSCLDIVISVPTAVFPMAAALGIPALQLNARHWANFGQPVTYPWFRNARITDWNGHDPMAGELNKVPALMDEMLGDRH